MPHLNQETAQFLLCLNLKVARVLARMAKEAKFKTVESLMESMLFEIALDQIQLRKEFEFDKLKSNRAKGKLSSVASAIK